ncbi:CBS domain-containing protein [Pimelobacter simplex]|uniref:Inosine-5'-monophosphate dehydrogenase n=1 Tax=Nocardioides simplex TaxID=2045 RepID=A0A0A1DK87_NOCSI|nr:CBS domain-containing protein [Pimelobacter simplex]AIY17012.1 Inosine-5'-monophosphate dehydrogenase [Pimelobacter simplex]MCG8152197.1 CBS domain-containing protein [Pimelobacter simplex]GEB12941.1 histidine kinase [Pimelobacter simplex]SFM51905.1 CBS domain-containing protein [Pimelobacter simplex]
MRIADILQSKSLRDVVTIRPDAGVRELLATLAEHNIGAVVVSSDGTALEGIVSERDVVRHLHSDGTVINNVVSAIMTAEVRTCSPDDDLDEVMQVMTDGRFRHIPVASDDGAVVGIVSIGDMVKHKIDQLQFERDQLDNYVHQS